MDTKSQFAGRYKKDMSIDNLRVKIARRKSVRQKENRDKEFRKSRGLALMDANVSVGKEQDLAVLEEVNEPFFAKGSMDKTAVPGKKRDNISYGRRVLLQRYLEEKELRKLKVQREKANKGVFKCGLYKPENPFIPVTSQHAVKVKMNEKPVPPAMTRVTRPEVKIDASVFSTRSRPAQTVQPAVTRVTRSAARIDVHNPLSRPTQVPVLNKIVEQTSSKGHGQMSAPKKNKENKVTAIPSARTTRATAALAATSRLPTVKAIDTSVMAKLHKRTKVNSEQESALPKPKPAVLDQEKSEELKPEVAVEEKLKPDITIEVTAVESEILTETSVREEREPSFAPENFVFQPMDGLSTFKFQPMTPKRANAFLTPTFTWSPVDGKSNFVFTREHETEENKVPQVSPPDLPMKTASVELEIDTCATAEAKGDVLAALPVREESLPACDQNACTPTDNPQLDETHRDVPYFRGLLKSEIQKLTLLCSEWDKRIIEEDIPEDSKDLIRTTVGQTRLLMTERFKQFEGLVDNCEFKRGEKETTCTDLDGFWDMIYFQIEDVKKKFVLLETLEKNAWQQTTVQAKKVVRKKAVLAPTVNKSQGETARAAARSRLAVIKAAMRNRVKQEEVAEEAFVSEKPMQVEPVVFDAGFFRIESPAKLPGCIRTKTSSQTSDAPKSSQKIQHSDNPMRDGTEEGADHMHVQKSPSPTKSPVRKALFDTKEESFQHHQEDSVVTISENTESETVSQVADLTKYLVHTTEVTESVADSPGFMEFPSSVPLVSSLGEDSIFEVTSTVVDDVFMCSPEKVQESKIRSPEDHTIEILPDEDIKISNDPLDFLESCTSNMVTHTPLKSESITAVSDLMVFSPMQC